ncbi:MAG: hypothetical protein BJ554DRAFT_4007 [Olpidium bornovanus]|uniref:Uncharacterized protein n=1 Tax=Olpidium bornovanus TaxID=278681 RepID=A0A8H7ZNC4_9FUNG|nr:MAG: hypothetical protein BJ554DRAFT_4007 [Olpidium bornovanus]
MMRFFMHHSDCGLYRPRGENDTPTKCYSESFRGKRFRAKRQTHFLLLTQNICSRQPTDEEFDSNVSS